MKNEQVAKTTENKKSTIYWIASSIFGGMLNSAVTQQNTLLLPDYLRSQQGATETVTVQNCPRSR